MRFIIIGDPLNQEYAHMVEATVWRLPGVWLLPGLPQHDFHMLLRSASVLVNSSISEGMCGSILEAMACNIPVAARDIEGNACLVQHMQTGVLFETPAEFVAMTEMILKEATVRAKCVTAAREMIRRNHTPAAEREAYHRVVSAALT